MTPPLDDGVKNLQAFCELLEATNPVLESGTSSLDQLARSLSDHESRLSLELDHLATDVDGLQKEAEATGAAAVKACEELAQAAEDAKANTLADLEKEAAEAESQWTRALQEKSGALGTAFDEIKSSGWEPLQSAVDQERSDFEKWTPAADSALDGLVQALTAAAADIERDGSEVKTAAQFLAGAEPAKDDFWHQLGVEVHRTAYDMTQQFVDSMPQRVADLEKADEELVSAVGDGCGFVRGQLDLTLQKAADAVDALSGELTSALDNTVEALGRAQTEFERSAVQAEQAETTARDMVELAGHAAQAKAQLQTINAVTEVLGP